ncbi:class I SAM-dependent methyltransferase [Longitalea luteola]|uniref:class I SAM-dependent methyltransferase n=1 Tax=Longitalea luteola TaxID=2812563 RepID=UPI001A9570A8|nr:class I SAM-dependent methyltransferase [Longitalea luteola]
MKLFLIRYTKIAFLRLRLHVIFNIFSSLLSNLYHLTKLSAWASRNRKIGYNDFPCKWDYEKRYGLYKWVIEKENLQQQPINYLEFGVAQGHSFKWFLQQNTLVESRFYGFDTFTGLPEDYGPYKKGHFDNKNEVPVINDSRGKFFQGLFQQTVPGFLKELNNNNRNVIMLDADLYSATLYVLSTLAPFLKKGDIVFFDEFAVPTHEFKAYFDFVQSYYTNLELIGAANNYYFTAFRVN